MDQRFCKKCLIKDMDEETYRELIKKHTDIIDISEKTEKKTYENRLKICKECDKLENGTCLKCGCYVEIRAASKRSTCPGKKW